MNKCAVLVVFVFLFSIASTANAFLPLTDGTHKVRILPELETVTPQHKAGPATQNLLDAFGPDARFRIGTDMGGLADRIQSAIFRGAERSQPVDLVQERSVALAGTSHLRYRQTYDGTPVVGRGVSVHLDGRGAVQDVQSNFLSQLRITNERSIDADEALRAALAYLEAEASDRAAPKVDGVLLPVGGNECIEAFQVLVATDEPLGDWRVTLNAADGSVLGCENQIQAARGSVYKSHPLAGGAVAVTLKNLDSSGNLKGAYARVLNDDTDEAHSADGKFLYDTTDTHFDEVMVFYHMNIIHDYFKSMGFNDLDEPLRSTVHYRTNYDNAFFSPWGKSFSFGDGNKLNDLATEAGVIYHEYTHAVTNEIQSMVYSGESGAMNEGFSDYFACTQDGDALLGEWIMKKLNKPYMRTLNNNKHYPEDIEGEVHRDGEIWGAAMWAVRKKLGKAVADKVIHRCRYYLSSRAKFSEGLAGLIKADKALFGGSHEAAIKQVLGAKGIKLETESAEETRQGHFATLYGPRS